MPVTFPTRSWRGRTEARITSTIRFCFSSPTPIAICEP